MCRTLPASFLRLMLLGLFLLVFPAISHASPSQTLSRTITDATGKKRLIPAKVKHVICSGSGCLRLLTYLQGQSLVVGVDDMEAKRHRFEARPYALANPFFKKLPVFGEFRGHDNPEQILTLSPQPDVIFKTFAKMGTDPEDLARKTGIPVIVLNPGDLGHYRQNFYQALRIMGEVIGKEERARQVINFFETNICEITSRSQGIPQASRPRVYIGGVAYKGPHGFQSTEPGYPPFEFLSCNNVARTPGLTPKNLRHSDVSKEKILEWNPEALFLDLSTLQSGHQGGLKELRTDPAYQTLTAVHKGKVYGVLPYNWYSQNFGSILADAWFIGTILYPEQFKDIEPKAKADAIYTFLVGQPVFNAMQQAFGNLVFSPIPLDTSDK